MKQEDWLVLYEVVCTEWWTFCQWLL